MHDRPMPKDLLHGPWPSHAEALQGLYGDIWNIYRDRGNDGHHGDWIAKRRRPLEGHTNEIAADSSERLGEKLRLEDA